METLRRAGQAFEYSDAKEEPAVIKTELSVADAHDVNEHIERLQGTWNPVSITMDGNVLPESYFQGGTRVMKQTETTVTMFGQIWLRARTHIRECAGGLEVDYQITHGPAKGQAQLGIVVIEGDQATFCMGKPGGERPKEFVSKPGSGRTLSVWKLESN